MAYVVQGTWGCRTGMMRDIVRLPGRGGSVPTGSRLVRGYSVSLAGGPDLVHQLRRFALAACCEYPYTYSLDTLCVHTVLLPLTKRASVRILYRWTRFPLGVMKSRG